jgi:hypothetical protein
MEDTTGGTEAVQEPAKKKRPNRTAFTSRKRPRKKSAPSHAAKPSQEPQEPQDVSVPVSGSAKRKRSHANQQVAGQPDGEYQVTETVAVTHDPARAHLPTGSRAGVALAKDGRRVYSTEDLRARRMGIYYFDTIFGSPPESDAWGGRNGHVATIRDSLLLPNTSSLRYLRKTLRVIRSYQEQNKEYKGEREPRKAWARHLIPIKSYESQLIAELIGDVLCQPIPRRQRQGSRRSFHRLRSVQTTGAGGHHDLETAARKPRQGQ